jgi:polygalacturonase
VPRPRRSRTRDAATLRLAVALAGLLAAGGAAPAKEPAIFNVREYGAAGDGRTLDTAAINGAIEACARAGGGQVRLPPGTYLSGTVHLKSRLTLCLDAGARLVGTKDLDQYRHFEAAKGSAEARFATRWHRALILGVGVEDVTIAGPGTIDGHKVFDPRGEEKMRGPHTILLGDARNVTIRDITIRDSANYAVLIQVSDRVDVQGVTVTGGWDGVHFRGWKDRPCHDIRITGCRFFTGDDAIAGRYVENLLVADCVVNSSCNGMRIIGPMTHMVVHDCLFYGPGVHPHRTQNRNNMLSGILLQPGAWDPCEGALRDVLVSHVTMKNVASPVSVYLRRPGHEAGDVTVTRLTATGVYRSAASVESWTDVPVGRVVFRDVSIEYAGGGKPSDDPAAAEKPGLDARGLPAWGFYARHVKDLVLEDVRLGWADQDLRPAVVCDGVERLRLDGLRLPHPAQGRDPVVLKDVRHLDFGRADLPPREEPP